MAKAVVQEAKPGERLSRARQRQKLIDACITALHQHGPSRTTIDKVVSIADMSPGIVNFYFETKAALLVAALEYLAVEFETRVLEPVAALRDRPMVALDRLIELYLDPDVASARKVSVWYSFWGESSSRREYYTICGKRDLAFAALVQGLVAREITDRGFVHLDADAVALGLIGCLEMMWQEIAFQDDADVDRDVARRRCRAYVRSVFPLQASVAAVAAVDATAPDSDSVFKAELGMFRRSWQFACSAWDVLKAGNYVAWEWAAGRTLVVRGADAAIAAYVNTCRHRPHVLVAGEAGHLDGDIVCPADGAVHRLDGGGLAELPVVMNDFAVFVAREAAAGAAPRFSLAGVAPAGAWACTDVAANWKLVVEHWADSYLDESARTFGAGSQGAVRDIGGKAVSRSFEVGDETGWISQRLYGRLHAAAGLAVERMLIWPNLFVERRADGMTIRQCLPLAAGRSRIRLRRYRAAKADRALRAMFYLAMRMERVWQREDVRLIESMQGGEERRVATGGTALNAFWAWMDGAG
jgi:AcrR family transcriptional regulator